MKPSNIVLLAIPAAKALPKPFETEEVCSGMIYTNPSCCAEVGPIFISCSDHASSSTETAEEFEQACAMDGRVAACCPAPLGSSAAPLCARLTPAESETSSPPVPELPQPAPDPPSEPAPEAPEPSTGLTSMSAPEAPQWSTALSVPGTGAPSASSAPIEPAPQSAESTVWPTGATFEATSLPAASTESAFVTHEQPSASITISAPV